MVLLTMACTVLRAQAPAALSFEVASIHASEPGLVRSSIGTDPGKFDMRNVSLRRSIEWAYELNPNQLMGPAWLDDVRFDITARAEDHSADDDQLHLMLQRLLADRFGLRVHRERKEEQVYSLTVAPNGLKLHVAGTRDGSTFVESPGEGPNSFSEDKTGAMARHVSMADVARKVSQMLGRVVTDKTGLDGRYDFRLDLTPYMNPEAENSGPKADIMSVLFAGFNDQLGLKLVPGKEMVDLLVIDSVNRTPTDN